MEKGNIHMLKVGIYMKENFNMELKKVKVFLQLKNINMMEIGIMIYPVDLEML